VPLRLGSVKPDTSLFSFLVISTLTIHDNQTMSSASLTDASATALLSLTYRQRLCIGVGLTDSIRQLQYLGLPAV